MEKTVTKQIAEPRNPYHPPFNRLKVVITGIGAVSPIGIGREKFSVGLQQGEIGIDRISSLIPPVSPRPLVPK
jgi:hypothetical protein